MRSRMLFALALTGAVTGCFDFGGGNGGGCSPPPNGLAGKATFEYACNGAGDPYCEGQGLLSTTQPASLPAAVARGASFGVLYDDKPAEVVSTLAVKPTNGRFFIAQRPGPIGFLAGEANGEVVDVQRIEVVEPESISVGAIDAPLFGSSASGSTFRAVAMAKGKPIPGALRVTWSVDDPSIAVVYPRSDGIADVDIVGPGATTLRASFGTLGAAVTVGAGFGPPRDAGSDADASDASDDASDAGGDQ